MKSIPDLTSILPDSSVVERVFCFWIYYMFSKKNLVCSPCWRTLKQLFGIDLLCMFFIKNCFIECTYSVSLTYSVAVLVQIIFTKVCQFFFIWPTDTPTKIMRKTLSDCVITVYVHMMQLLQWYRHVFLIESGFWYW